jgi:type II secretory pathway pseudopilin PulG
MTLVEVVVAIVIFFFVLTAIFGLLGATTNMSLLSNERALLVNAMNSYIEEVRSMPYTSVGVDMTGAPVPGTLSVETTETVGSYQLVITPTITWVDDPSIAGATNYKQLTVDGSLVRGGEVVYTLSMSTYIRQEAPPGDYQPPTIVFGPGSPLESSPPTVVRGRTVLIDAIAESTMPGARLVSMSFQVSPGGIYLRDQAGGSRALGARHHERDEAVLLGHARAQRGRGAVRHRR